MIFYFSSTGNSAYVARIIKKRLDDRCIDMAKALKEGAFDYTLSDNERLGFVFPVYFGGLPTIVERFIKSLRVQTANTYYAYTVLTCGIMTGNAGRLLARALLRQGLTLSAEFAVQCINNDAILVNIPEGEARDDIEYKMQLMTEQAAEAIAERQTGLRHRLKGVFASANSFFMQPVYKIMRQTRHFRLSDTCSGCGLCAQLCPDSAITMDGNKPHWTAKECALCLGCLHRCPQKAINYGKLTQHRTRYKCRL
ncbi:MAG: EFR1 family ferrodoxin [Proteobacteria bacterium]|nr:EFR1 family ferrodoxin [Pseudomonadota bacterium]